MRVLLTVLLVGCWLGVYAQEPAASHVYTDTQLSCRITYPGGWQWRRTDDRTLTTFAPGETAAAPAATLTVRSLPAGQQSASPLAQGQQDSVWHSIRRLPQAQVLRLDQRTTASYEEVRYHYTFAADSASAIRTRVVGRRLWRGGSEFQVEYRGVASSDGRSLVQGEQVVESFGFTGNPPARRSATPLCDDKMYGIAALRYNNDALEDDCRTIHEFVTSDLSAPPRIHRQVLPFQSYALAKGFDNCLYSATKAPTNQPEYVYRYNPATRQGEYTPWQLPAQGSESVWISAATDGQGNLYFMTSDANKLVKVSPHDGSVTTIWNKDPLRQAPYYPAIGFAGAGSHGNFCLDDANTVYEVYSTDGSVLKVDLSTRQPAPEQTFFTGLPKRGGYSDLLLQHNEAGRRRLYLAGPTALYQVDMERGQAYLVRRGIYTDLAGCNLFRAAAGRGEGAPAAATAATVWRGRVLDAVTLRPLPQAQLRLSAGGPETVVPLTPEGTFSFPATAGRAYKANVLLPGYLPLDDSTFTTRPGPYVQDILLQPLAVGTTLRLNNVQFEQGKTRMLPASYPALDQLLALLKDNPRLTIELRGHTDNVGDPQKNLALSEQRVAAVKIYLVGLGISPRRITGLGLGGAAPRASNAREATRQLNRRVEFRITGTQ